MGEIFRRIRYLIHRRRFDVELASDMEFHREMAARAGRNNFGNTLRIQEQAREAWGWTWLDRLIQDLRYAVRILARSPGFTLMAVLVLAIGIGVNVAAFTVFDVVALEPLPVRDPGSLVRLERRSPNAYTDGAPNSSLLFYEKNAKTLSQSRRGRDLNSIARPPPRWIAHCGPHRSNAPRQWYARPVGNG